MATKSQMFNIFRYSAQEEGLNWDDVSSSMIYELRKRYRHYSTNDKLALGLNDEMFDDANLYEMIRDGKFRAVYDTNSEDGRPAWQLELDIDGDGIYSTISDPFTSGAGLFVPDKTVDRWKAIAPNELKEQLIAKRSSQFLNQMQRKKRPLTGLDQWWAGVLGKLTVNIEEKGKEWAQDFEDAIGVELWDQATVDQLAMQNMEELEALQKINAYKGLTSSDVFKGDMVIVGEGEDRKVIKSENILYDYISNHEGVRTNAYQDHLGYWTVGVGFRIDDENQKIFEKYGYSNDKLISGEQTMSIDHIVGMMVDDFLPKYMGLTDERNGPAKLYGDIFDFKNQENSYLLMALTDFNFWAGSEVNKAKGTSGFIGETTKFYKALREVGNGNDAAWGAWGVDDPNTVMGQLTLDYNAYLNKGGSGNVGMAKRIKENADFMSMWKEGRYATIPSTWGKHHF